MSIPFQIKFKLFSFLDLCQLSTTLNIFLFSRIFYLNLVKDLPMPTCSVPEKIVIYEHHCDNKFGNIVFVRKGKAQNNFLKHCENNDVKKVQAMIKRGSLIGINTVNSDTVNINKSAK